MAGRILIAIVVLVAVAAAAGWLLSAPRSLSADDLPEHAPDPEHGEYVFRAGGCASCHATPDQDDHTRLGGGRALETPFGTFRVPNISPHPEAGLGGWSTLDFINALLRGVSPGGRHYYPAFPYTSYQRMRPEDAIDLKAYLDTLEPVDSADTGHDLAFPYSIRRGVGLWKRLYLDGAAFAADPDHDETEARGAYLVRALAHCGECHTPRDAFGGPDESRRHAGGPAPEGDGRIPNITPHDDGIADWSEGDIAYALESGFTPEFDSLGGHMARVVRFTTSHLDDDDRAAIAAYLETVEPAPDE